MLKTEHTALKMVQMIRNSSEIHESMEYYWQPSSNPDTICCSHGIHVQSWYRHSSVECHTESVNTCCHATKRQYWIMPNLNLLIRDIPCCLTCFVTTVVVMMVSFGPLRTCSILSSVDMRRPSGPGLTGSSWTSAFPPGFKNGKCTPNWSDYMPVMTSNRTTFVLQT